MAQDEEKDIVEFVGGAAILFLFGLGVFSWWTHTQYAGWPRILQIATMLAAGVAAICVAVQAFRGLFLKGRPKTTRPNDHITPLD